MLYLRAINLLHGREQRLKCDVSGAAVSRGRELRISIVTVVIFVRVLTLRARTGTINRQIRSVTAHVTGIGALRSGHIDPHSETTEHVYVNIIGRI